jgi:hypothetical protein
LEPDVPTVPSVPNAGELSDDEVFGTPVEKVAPAAPAPMPAPVANDAAPPGELSDMEVFGPATADLKVRVREAARAGAGVTPDAMLEAEALGRRYGIPSDIARRNAAELKRRAEVDDFAALVDTNPKLAAWFAEDADAAVVAKPDIENLSWLERKLGIEAPLRGTAAGDALQGYADVLGSVPQGIGQPLGQAVSGVGGLIDAGARQIDRGVRWVAGDDIADMFWFDGPRYANPSNILQDVGEGIEAGTGVLAPPEERQNLATDIASGLGQVATYATVTALTGGAGGLVLGAGQGADIQADRAREAGTYGTGGADAALVGGAAITSVTERLGLNWLFRRLPAGVQKSLQKRVTDILMAGAGEAAQEVTEGVAQDALTKALVDSDYEMFAGLDREALTAGGVGLIVRSMLHLGKGRVDAEQAKVERDQIAEVGKVVDGMALAEQDPARLRAALAKLKSAGWADVWVPVKEWQTLFQSPQESDAARKAAGVSDADYTAALLGGGKLRVPTEGFYTGLTPEQRKPLYEHARRSPEGMSPTEADQYDPEVALGEIMAEFGVEGRPAGDPSNAVYDDMRLQLERAGASPDVASAQAEQFAAFVRTMQARAGVAIDPNRVSVVAKMDPRLQAVLRGKNAEPALDSLIAAVRSNREFTEAEIMGDRLVSGLIRAGGINPESVGGGDLRAMDARYRPGLLNLGGMTLDDAVIWAREAGFIDRPLSNEGEVYDADAPDINTLLEMISGDLSGVAKAYVRDDMNVDRQAFNAGVAALREELDARGITDERLAEMSDEDVRAALGFGPEVEGDVLNQVSPETARGLKIETKLPTDTTFTEAVANTAGAEITPDGLEMDLVRFQKPEQSGDTAIRTGVFYIPAGSKDARHYKGAGKSYGGSEKVQGRVLLRRPLFVKGATGGKAPENAYDQIKGKGAYQKMRDDVLGAMAYGQSLSAKADRAGEVLDKYGADSDIAYELVRASQQGNTFAYAMQENIVAHAVREAGYDSVVGYGKAKTGPFISEVFDVREITYPTEDGESDIHEKFYQSAHPQIDLTPGPASRRIKTGDTTLTYAVGEDGAKIILVRTPKDKRGQGGARKAMQEFLAATDAAGLPVTLTVAEQDATTDAGKLRGFYESLGFVAGEGDSMARPAAASDAASASDVTQNAAFKAWFGDSKVVDADGKPLVVYHGSPDARFVDEDGAFKSQRERYGFGKERGAHWFASSKETARSYMDPHRAFDYQNAEPGMVEAYLKIENPLIVDASGSKWRDAQKLGKTGDVIQKAQADGHDGVIIRNVRDNYQTGVVAGDKPTNTYVVFDSTQIKSATGNRGTFDPNDPSILNQDARGSLTISPSRYPGGARQFVIQLGEARDFSTFLHESAHFYLEIMREIDADLRARDPATLTPDQQKVLADHDALLAQLGVPTFDAITVDQHEAFAETYEAYLREGKAPSVRLNRAFQKFGAWLKMIYRTLRGLPNQRLNDETRAIFDRMLATDDEIDAARSAQKLGALFDTPEAAGMTPDEFGQYQEALRVARDSAIQDEAAEQYRYELAETRRWQAEEMARIRAEVTPLVDANPGMKAKYLLRKGTLPDGSPLPAGQSPIKLDTAAVTDKYGKAWVQKNLAFMVAKGGAHPDLAAPVLGFKNGEELITALANTPNRQEAIKAEADALWRERHPDPMLDGATADRVQQRVHNDAQAEVMIREINALNARAGREPGKPTVLAVMKQAAERIVAGQRVGSLNPNQHRQTEAKAGRDALKAAAAGKWDEAVSARRRQLFAGLMYRASLDARERAEAVREKMIKLARKPAQERFARAGWESYLERVNDILHAFDVRRLSEKQLARRRSMRAWVEAQQEAGDVTAITEELIARVEAQSVQNWRDATVAELDAAGDALTNIEHLARLKNKLVAGARAAEKDAAIDEMVARAEESLPDVLVRPVSGADLTTGGRVARTLASKRDEVTRPENFIEALDGGVSGPWHDFVWSAMDKAEAKMQGLRKEIGARLKALRTEMPKEVMAGLGAPVTVFGIPTTRASLIGAVLNTGNAGNLQRLKDGGIAFGDQRLRLTDAQIDALRGQLTAAELRYVQGLWTTVNSLWGDIVALQRQMSGLPPEKVEAREFTVTSADGAQVTLEGGYWPLAYDRDRSAVGENQSSEDALRQMMGQGFTKAATPKGYQKARVAEFEAPLQLDFGAVMSHHLDQVMTDIAYRGAVRDVMGLLNDQRVKDTVLARLGRPAYDSLRGMVSYAVSGSSAVAGAAARGWQTLADGILSNMTVSALAIRPDIALGNYASALVQGLDRSGLKALLRGLWRTYTPGRGDMTAEIKALSPFMAERLTDTDYLYTRELGRTRRERGLGPAYKRVVLTLHRAADHEVTRALWWGKYQAEIDRGETQAEAVRLADKVIRQTQTATGRKDLSTFERDPAFRQSRQFMGPMFVIFGRMAAAARGQGATQAVGARLSTAMLQVFLAPALFAFMAGRWPEEDGDDEDDEIGANEWAMWLAANTLLFPLQTLPFLRDVGSGIEAALTGNPINPRAAPVSAAGANMVKAGDSLWSAIEDYRDTGEVDYYEMTRDLTTLAAPLTGAPASQVRNTTRAIEAMRDNPDSGAVEMATMAVYGKPPPIQ